MDAAQEHSSHEASRVIVVCCDGTWNKPEDQTNVWRAYQFLRLHCISDGNKKPEISGGKSTFTGRIPVRNGSDETVELKAFYSEGVGDQRGGGSLGVGLGEKVREAYKFVAEHWQVGCHIYIFGFSRGAFTARSLSGMLNVAGVVRPEDASIDKAWDYYRLTRDAREDVPQEYIKDLQRSGAARPAVVRFLGVWDTVGSLGVPGTLRSAVDRLFGKRYAFHNTGLGGNVLYANQALAIHEQRGAFKPVMWTRRHAQVADEGGDQCKQHMMQVWFTGSHSDVGGGYRGDTGLADITLTWMLRRAEESGLALGEAAWRERFTPDPLSSRNDSSTRLWRIIAGERSAVFGLAVNLMPAAARATLVGLGNLLTVHNFTRSLGGETPTDHGYYVVGLDQRIHQSVTERYRGEHVPKHVQIAIAAGVPIFQERSEPRQPCAPNTKARIDGEEALLFDRSDCGIGVSGLPWLERGKRYPVGLDDKAWVGQVAWAAGDRAGVALLHRQRNGVSGH